MERDCDVCGATYVARRASSRYCSGPCRAKASRQGGVAPRAKTKPAPVVALPELGPVPVPARSGPLEEATRAELDAADRTSTSAGQRALALARLIDEPPAGTYGAVSGWSREHGAAMAVALAGVEVARKRTALDEIKARRDAKRRGA